LTGRLNWIVAARFANKWDHCCEQAKVYLPSLAPGWRRAVAPGLNGARYDMVRVRRATRNYREVHGLEDANARRGARAERPSRWRCGRPGQGPAQDRATLFDRRVHGNHRRAGTRRSVTRRFDRKSIASLVSSLRRVFVSGYVELF
jgi:hypothetical protein